MPFRQTGSLRLYQFQSLDHPRLVHSIFTRKGGVSPEPWSSLNVGSTVGDDLERVAKNKCLAFRALERSINSAYEVWQMHSDRVVVADAPRGECRLKKADAIITNNPEVTLFMRFADCVPILLFDPQQKAIGLAHAGWLGSVRMVAKAVVNAMIQVYGCKPADLIAGIGPSIGVDHYIIGSDVVDRFHKAFDKQAESFLVNRNGQFHLDLWKTNYEILAGMGLKNIEVAGLCTACNLEDWYSHRGESGRTGRFGALIALK